MYGSMRVISGGVVLSIEFFPLRGRIFIIPFEYQQWAGFAHN